MTKTIKKLLGHMSDKNVHLSKDGQMLRSYSRGIGSEGLRPQLVHCAPLPSIALYFRILYVLYPKIQMAIVAYPKVQMTII
jgi:hypothetical protein